ncbi:PIN domain-containing protein [Variovorax sp. LjRoot290]|uniref:PIN domain-containing protein n=1 Tax=Variovorax sp. LjRoot290 TaxID=3342316 RepID=UPI003ECEB93D
MIIPVVADADTLFPATTRGLLIYLDYRGVIKLHWSPLILDEMSRALVDAGRKHSLADAKAHEKRMCDALPNATVAAAVVQSLFKDVAHAVNSPKDIHVAACARSLIAANAYPASEAVVLTTRNTKDFKKGALAGLGIELRKPDAFLQRLFAMQAQDFAFAFNHFRRDLVSKPQPEVLLEKLRLDGQEETARALLAAHRAGVVKL